MYQMIFAFPISDIVQSLRVKLPPWREERELDIIAAIIRYWIHNDHYLLLPDIADEHLVYKWTELTNDFDTAMKFYKILEGPTHPSWNPAFDMIPTKVKITSRSLFLVYNFQ
jgi:hypothetical protein